MSDNGGRRRNRRRAGRGQNEAPGAPLWMVTYSDMVTLLLAFFVLLFSFSELDTMRFRSIMLAFQASVGVLDGGMRLVQDDTAIQGRTDFDLQDINWNRPELQQQLSDVHTIIQAFLTQRDFGDTMQVALTERGVTVRFADRVLFDLGKAELKSEALAVLSELAGLLETIPNHVRVEGHTDDLPINNERFPSNWELSTARATTVLRYLVEEHGMAPDSLSAAGYGEYRPIEDNATAENRAQNRRVDIVLLRLDLGE